MTFDLSFDIKAKYYLHSPKMLFCYFCFFFLISVNPLKNLISSVYSLSTESLRHRYTLKPNERFNLTLGLEIRNK